MVATTIPGLYRLLHGTIQFIFVVQLAQVPRAGALFFYDEVVGDDVTMETRYGTLLGRRRSEHPDVGGITSTVDYFLGVPYAAPPLGNLRFEPPREPSPWPGVRRAVRAGKLCPQEALDDYAHMSFQSEDCLTLSIYSPAEVNKTDARYPVMVFIHGGSYSFEGAAVRPAGALASYGVVVVVIQYRLGALGFMTTGRSDFPGNYGLLDQVAALKWVQENIVGFRGNPDQVTIFGNSAGGSSVGFLCLSPLAKGLFRYAIAQSGSLTAEWATYNKNVDPLSFIHKYMDQLGCPTSTLAMLRCLRQKPWTQIMKIQFQAPKITSIGTNFVPRVDGRVIPAYPLQLLKTGRINAEVYLTGVTLEEHARNMQVDLTHTAPSGLTRTESHNLGKGLSRATKDTYIMEFMTRVHHLRNETANVLRYSYTDWQYLNDPIRNRDLLVEFRSDHVMNAPMMITAKMLRQRGLPVYMYHFTHRAEAPSGIIPPIDWYMNSSYHGLEISYVLGSVFDGVNVARGRKQTFTEQDRDLSRRMMRMWTDFARTGNPTPQTRLWKEFEVATTDHLEIASAQDNLRQHYRPARMALWLQLLPQIDPNAEFQTFAQWHGQNISTSLSSLEVGLICVVVILTFTLVSFICLCLCRRRRRPLKAAAC